MRAWEGALEGTLQQPPLINCSPGYSRPSWPPPLSCLPSSILYICAVCSVMSDSLRSHGLQPTRLLCPWNFPGKNTGVDSHFLLQGMFPTQGSNWHLLHLLIGRWILYSSHHLASHTSLDPISCDYGLKSRILEHGNQALPHRGLEHHGSSSALHCSAQLQCLSSFPESRRIPISSYLYYLR